jgi:hypothetical protein
VAEAEQLGVRLGGEEARLDRDSGKKFSARPIAWENGHEMRIVEPGRRCKLSPVWCHGGYHTEKFCVSVVCIARKRQSGMGVFPLKTTSAIERCLDGLKKVVPPT